MGIFEKVINKIFEKVKKTPSENSLYSLGIQNFEEGLKSSDIPAGFDLDNFNQISKDIYKEIASFDFIENLFKSLNLDSMYYNQYFKIFNTNLKTINIEFFNLRMRCIKGDISIDEFKTKSYELREKLCTEVKKEVSRQIKKPSKDACYNNDFNSTGTTFKDKNDI